jgi:hypothetical protein
LKRAYRQFPICPGDLHLVGFNWNGYWFATCSCPKFKVFTNKLIFII